MDEAVEIKGRVIQRVDGGLLVDCHSGTHATVLLADYADSDEVVDDALVSARAYPAGRYEYVAVNGSNRTVRKYSCDLWSVR